MHSGKFTIIQLLFWECDKYENILLDPRVHGESNPVPDLQDYIILLSTLLRPWHKRKKERKSTKLSTTSQDSDEP